MTSIQPLSLSYGRTGSEDFDVHVHPVFGRSFQSAWSAGVGLQVPGYLRGVRGALGFRNKNVKLVPCSAVSCVFNNYYM